MEADERLRLFCALLLPAGAVETLVRWQAAGLATRREDLRIVPRENLHVTLAFLGGTRAAELPRVVEALRHSRVDEEPPLFAPRCYRETRSVGMIELADDQGRAARLAARLWERLERLGVYERERRDWRPHVTVVRFLDRPRLALEPPELGDIRTSDAAVMISRLRPGGAQYEVLESVSLLGG